MSKENIIFYSKKCKFCNQLINLINEVDNLNNFKCVCIDNIDLNQIPYIDSVPCLIIKEIKKPLIGVNAFNYIKSRPQLNRITNNINSNPNKFNNPKDNPLLYDVNDGPNGLNNNNNSNYLFLKRNLQNMDNISYLKNKNQDIYTLPEGSKINKINQGKKLNMLLNQRAQQDFNIFGSGVKTTQSSNVDKINVLGDINNDLNERINKINFVVEPQLNIPNITNKSSK